jgi:hypothetical protein
VDKLPPYAEVMAKGQSGDTFPSKKAMRETIAETPGFVVFTLIGTPTNGLRDQLIGNAKDLAPLVPSAGIIIHGPDPYRHRTWIATVTVRNDKLVVK